MPRDEATVDRIFAGNLDDLPPLSSKVQKNTKKGRSLIFDQLENILPAYPQKQDEVF